jgi:ribosomal protein S18 acetylase RimI-like enzyme
MCSVPHPKLDLDHAPAFMIVPMSLEMTGEAARVHLQAFEGYMNTRIGISYLRAFMDWFCKADCAIALVAMNRSENVLGYVVGAPLGYSRPMNRDLFWAATQGIIVRPWLFFSDHFRETIVARLKLLLDRSPKESHESDCPGPTMSLVGIGVSPNARGAGIGIRLLQEFEAKARELQMRSVRLSVYPDNFAARRLYERCGWQPLSSSAKGSEAMHYFRIL